MVHATSGEMGVEAKELATYVCKGEVKSVNPSMGIRHYIYS